MDDLKLIRRYEEELRSEIRFVKTISDDMKMKFGIKQCTRLSLKSGKIHENDTKDTLWRMKLRN
jgi:hypothetical protein